jgi:peroxiredoxin
VIGVSFNAPARNKAWSDHEKFPFEVWSDTAKTLALAFSAVSSRLSPVPSRVTVLLDEKGDVVLQYMKGIEVGTHPADVLADCKKLFGNRTAAQP